MSKRKWLFQPTEVRRAIATVQDTGLEVRRVEIAKDGRIILGTAKPNENDATVNEWSEDLYAKDQAAPVR
jgi:hypothetical protein